MRDRQTCIDCSKQSPETETNYTLISAQFGWRLTRRRLTDGTFVVEWRCPECWKAFKSTKAGNEPIVGWPSAGEPAPSSRGGAGPTSSVRTPRPPSSHGASPPASGTRGSTRPPPRGTGNTDVIPIPRPPAKPR